MKGGGRAAAAAAAGKTRKRQVPYVGTCRPHHEPAFEMRVDKLVRCPYTDETWEQRASWSLVAPWQMGKVVGDVQSLGHAFCCAIMKKKRVRDDRGDGKPRLDGREKQISSLLSLPLSSRLLQPPGLLGAAAGGAPRARLVSWPQHIGRLARPNPSLDSGLASLHSSATIWSSLTS